MRMLLNRKHAGNALETVRDAYVRHYLFTLQKVCLLSFPTESLRRLVLFRSFHGVTDWKSGWSDESVNHRCGSVTNLFLYVVSEH